jgi:uncharacterized phage protein (TIGR01671 family)
MRELTFRIFDKKNKRMIDNCGLVDIDSTRYDFECEDFVFSINGYEIYKSDMVVNLYTGLNDTKGKMIYEGDIIRIKFITHRTNRINIFHPIDRYSEHLKVIEVKFDKGMFNIAKFYNYPHIVEECEIIGNIYQNPELLDENKEK